MEVNRLAILCKLLFVGDIGSQARREIRKIGSGLLSGNSKNRFGAFGNSDLSIFSLPDCYELVHCCECNYTSSRSDVLGLERAQ